MKILVLGSGGREHALTWKLRESQHMSDIWCAPGNAGIAQEAECLPVDLSQSKEIVEIARDIKADLTVVGPEAPLAAGVVDEFVREGLGIIGPSKAAAQLESSKVFSKDFMRRYAIPTARYLATSDFEEAVKSLPAFGLPVVIKADGLAAGKGVVVAQSCEQAEQALDSFMRQHSLGEAGGRVIVEEWLSGTEMSYIVLTDGRGVLPLAPTQDHKAIYDGDHGPNTGGMGAFSDEAMLTPSLRDIIMKQIVTPTLSGMANDGHIYRGFLYCGLMLTPEGPKLLEYNARLGDPEAQPIMMRLRSDLVELFLALRAEQLSAIEARWTPNPAVCVVMASGGYPGPYETGKQITGYEAAESMGGVKVFHAGTKVEDHRLLTNGGRVLGVTATGEDLRTTIERAYIAVGKIQFEGMHYRRDIGAKGLKHTAKTPEKKDPLPNPHPLSGPIPNVN